MRKEGENEKAAAELTESPQKTQKRQDEGKPTPAEKRATGAGEKGHRNFIYIGPSAPNGSLLRNTIFAGDRKQIDKHLADVMEKYPKVKNLIVPISELAAASREIGQTGHALNRYYAELIEEFRKGEDKQ